MSSSRNSFESVVKNYVASATVVFKKFTTFKPVDHFFQGAAQIFRAVSFVKNAVETRNVVKEIIKTNLSSAVPLFGYSILKDTIVEKNEYLFIGIMALDLAITVFVKSPLWVAHTIDNTADALTLPRAVENDIAHLLSHDMAQLLSEKLSVIFNELFLKGSNQNFFTDSLFINLYGVFKGFFKNPKKNLIELEKTLIDKLISTIETTIQKNECIKSDFKQAERKEVVVVIVKNLISILEKKLNNQEWTPEDAYRIPSSGMKEHLATGYIENVMGRIINDISKILNKVQPFLPIDSTLSCDCGLKKKFSAEIFKPFYVIAYSSAVSLPDALNYIVVVRPMPLMISQMLSSYMALLLKASSGTTKISGCTKHFSENYSNNQFFYLGISTVCAIAEVAIKIAYLHFMGKEMDVTDKFFLNDALINISLSFATVASLAFHERLPATQQETIDMFALQRKLARKTIKEMNQFFRKNKIKLPSEPIKKIKGNLNSPYLLVTLKWILAKETILPMQLFYLLKNPALKSTKEYEINLLPIIFQRKSIQRLLHYYHDDIEKALSMVKIMKMLTAFMNQAVKSVPIAFMTTYVLYPLYVLQDKSFAAIVDEIEKSIAVYNKQNNLEMIEEQDVQNISNEKKKIIVMSEEEKKKEDIEKEDIENDFVYINQEECESKLALQPSSNNIVSEVVSYLKFTIWKQQRSFSKKKSEEFTCPSPIQLKSF